MVTRLNNDKVIIIHSLEGLLNSPICLEISENEISIRQGEDWISLTKENLKDLKKVLKNIK